MRRAYPSVPYPACARVVRCCVSDVLALVGLLVALGTCNMVAIAVAGAVAGCMAGDPANEVYSSEGEATGWGCDIVFSGIIQLGTNNMDRSTRIRARDMHRKRQNQAPPYHACNHARGGTVPNRQQ